MNKVFTLKLTIDSELCKAFKIACVQNEKSMAAVVVELIQEFVEKTNEGSYFNAD